MKLEELIQAGDFDKAAALQQEITGLIYFTFKAASLYAAAKGVLKLRGVDIGSVRAPFMPLRDTDDVIIQELYEKIMDTMKRYGC